VEKTDLQLIEKNSEQDPDLAKLYKEHVKLERALDKINNKRYLSPKEDDKRRELQKMKLKGRDEIEKILSRYRG